MTLLHPYVDHPLIGPAVCQYGHPATVDDGAGRMFAQIYDKTGNLQALSGGEAATIQLALGLYNGDSTFAVAHLSRMDDPHRRRAVCAIIQRFFPDGLDGLVNMLGAA